MSLELLKERFGHSAFTTESGLVGYWRFEKGLGTTVEDLSGKGNHGTLTTDDESLYGLPAWNPVIVPPVPSPNTPSYDFHLE